MQPHHDVVYVHECPRNGRRRVHCIQYDNPEHELHNLETQREHFCPVCRQAMTRLGASVDLRKSGDGQEWLHPAFYDQDVADQNAELKG